MGLCVGRTTDRTNVVLSIQSTKQRHYVSSVAKQTICIRFLITTTAVAAAVAVLLRLLVLGEQPVSPRSEVDRTLWASEVPVLETFCRVSLRGHRSSSAAVAAVVKKLR